MLARAVAIARNPGQVGVASLLIKRTSGRAPGQRGQVMSSLTSGQAAAAASAVCSRKIACCGQGPASTCEWPWPACWQADKRSPTLRVLWGYSGVLSVGVLWVLWGYSGASALMASWRPTVAGRPSWPAGLGKSENGQNRNRTLPQWQRVCALSRVGGS